MRALGPNLAEFFQGFMHGPVDIYGEMELLHLLDRFFDRALCFATDGYEQCMQLHNDSENHAARGQQLTR